MNRWTLPSSRHLFSINPCSRGHCESCGGGCNVILQWKAYFYMRTRRLYRFVLISHECGLDSLGAGLRYLQAGAVPAGSQRLRFRLHTGGRGRRALPFHFVALEKTSEFQVLPGNHRPHLDRCRHHNASVARRLSPRLHFGYIGLLRAWLLFIKKKKERKNRK